ncbi:hypothetical protein K501DRAFT_168505 [Backusella circina FSU 941]|nr:hypothetical protein K501DRAFT_168505 [Backusella circina FSU 941]
MASEEVITKVIEALHQQLKDKDEVNNEKIAAIQLDNSTLSNTQARLETQVYAQEQDMNSLRKEVQQLRKIKKDIENKLVLESQNFESDKLNWQQKEGELYTQIKSLLVGEPRRTNKNSNQQEEEQVERPFKDTTREAKIAQRTIKAQDKLILDLRGELEKQKSLLRENQKKEQLQSLKVFHLEHEIQNVKQLNRSLQEDNESYQILLHEKTMTGEFMANPIMQVETSTYSSSASSDSSLENDTRRQSSGLNLAAELNMASDWNQKHEEEMNMKKLNDEIKTLQDTNRALQLYMNKILMKIINNKQLEDVLSIDQPKKEVPITSSKQVKIAPAPAVPLPVKTTSTSTSNAAKTVGNRPRRRTISYWGSKAPQPEEEEKENTKQKDETHLQAESRHVRRHSTMMGDSTGGGWAKALRRMSVIGWSAPKEDPMVAVNNDSAVGSLSEEDPATTKSTSSGSSTPSLRHSNELGTLAEEE